GDGLGHAVHGRHARVVGVAAPRSPAPLPQPLAMELVMSCCGHAFAGRRGPGLMASATAFFAALASGSRGTVATAPAGEASAAQKLLADNISIDVHPHGATGVIAAGAPNGDLARGMQAGRVAIVCLADVPDLPLLGRDEQKVLRAVRQPAPGQLYQYHLDRLAWIDELVAHQGIQRALTV